MSQDQGLQLPAPIDLFLNSRYANRYINGTTNISDMIFNFDAIQSVPNTDFQVKITNFVFPVSFYLVDSNNNTLVINSTVFTLTSGNYNATTFATMLTSVTGLTVTFSTTTGKYTFSRTTSSFFFASTSTCLTLLGFPIGQNTSTSTLVSPYTLVSSQLVNLSGQYNTVYVAINNIASGNISSINGRQSSIFASIPVNVPQGNLVYFVNQTNSNSRVQDELINYLHITILGEDLFTPVNFQGSYFNMNIEISYIPHIEILPIKNFNQLLETNNMVQKPDE
jgi:hypothetical protein